MKMHLLLILFSLLSLSYSLSPLPIQHKERIYYIAAVEVEWDYLPAGKDLFFPPGGLNQFQEQSIMTSFRKAVYRQFTDETFTTLVERDCSEDYLGILGPVIHATVGDTVKVVFKNMATYAYSLSAMISATKGNEGAMYQDETSGVDKQDDMVRPGETFTYTWKITKESGPGPNEPNSVLRYYHSAHDVVPEINSGLIGPIIISRRSVADLETGKAKDVDKEIITLFETFDEGLSYYAPINLGQDTSVVPSTNRTFIKHSINGFIFGNLPDINVTQGQKIRWHVFSSDSHYHTVHWQGNGLLYEGRKVNTVTLLPGVVRSLDMVPRSLGVWAHYCHVLSHISGGMVAKYRVLPSK